MTSSNRIVILTAGGLNPQLMINAVANQFPDIQVIFEQPESKRQILKRRRRHNGLIVALGQMMTMIVSRLSKRVALRRSEEIVKAYGLAASLSPSITQHHVSDINSDDCIALVQKLQPAAILTVSCRLLKKSTLAQITCPVINLHAGINPAYRGQMGGYWALVEGDHHNFGATVHLVDAGVDTGAMLYEQRVKPESSDTIATYPLLLTAASTQIVINALEDALSGSLSPKPPKSLVSKLRFPPTLWTWLYHGLTKGIW
jgi:folate-dependent phosphoribosylglycinamide formyltransferase PurN